MADDEYTIEELYETLSKANYSEEQIIQTLRDNGFTDEEIDTVIQEQEDEEDIDVEDWENKEKVKNSISKEEKNSIIRSFTELRELIYELEKKAEGKRPGQEFYEQVSEPLADTDTIRSLFVDIESYFNRPNLMNEFDKKQIDIILFGTCEDILDRLEALPDEIVNPEELDTLSTIARGLLFSIRNFLVDGKSKKAYKDMLGSSYKENHSNYEDKSTKELLGEALRRST